MSFSNLNDLGWRELDAPAVLDHQRPARVLNQGKGVWRVHDGSGELVARARSRQLGVVPVTGDWVLLSEDGGTAYIDDVLARRTVLARAEAGGRSEEQVIAANVDVVGICSPADATNARRLERELTAVWSSGAMPIVLITKADLVLDPWRVLRDLEQVCVGADVIVVSSVDGLGLDDVRAHIADGSTLALIGPSGVGKSSLVNALCGAEVLAAGAVREDGKGRHTTTSRHLVPVPGGGLLLDTPGMREFAPWADEEALAETFADLEDLAANCRFSDCRHESEPGCFVLISAAQDEVIAQRLANWRKLQRELAWLARRRDGRLMSEERKRWAQIAKSARSEIRP